MKITIETIGASIIKAEDFGIISLTNFHIDTHLCFFKNINQ
jgi:hypothetical protein